MSKGKEVRNVKDDGETRRKSNGPDGRALLFVRSNRKEIPNWEGRKGRRWGS